MKCGAILEARRIRKVTSCQLLGPVSIRCGFRTRGQAEKITRYLSVSIPDRGRTDCRRRLIDSLHATYGTLIDAFVMDALYANGPVMTQLDQCGYGGFVVLKKDNIEPLKEALALWQEQGPCEQYQDADKKEHLQFWTARHRDPR